MAELDLIYAERDHNLQCNWIWDFEDVAPPTRQGPTEIPTNQPPTLSVRPNPIITPSPRSNLRPPGCAISGGDYPEALFALELILRDPNQTGSAQVYYSRNYGDWTAAKPRRFHHSAEPRRSDSATPNSTPVIPMPTKDSASPVAALVRLHTPVGFALRI